MGGILVSNFFKPVQREREEKHNGQGRISACGGFAISTYEDPYVKLRRGMAIDIQFSSAAVLHVAVGGRVLILVVVGTLPQQRLRDLCVDLRTVLSGHNGFCSEWRWGRISRAKRFAIPAHEKSSRQPSARCGQSNMQSLFEQQRFILRPKVNFLEGKESPTRFVGIMLRAERERNV